jgi:hypothetical protein
MQQEYMHNRYSSTLKILLYMQDPDFLILIIENIAE